MGINAAQSGNIACDLYAFLGQKLFGNSASGHPAHGLSSRSSPAAAMVSKAVFGLVGVVSVARTGHIFYGIIGAGVGIPVPDDHGYGSASGQSLEDATQHLHSIFFFSLGCSNALSRTSAIQLFLDIFCCHRQASWTPIHHYAYSPAVRLAPSGNPKYCAESVSGHI